MEDYWKQWMVVGYNGWLGDKMEGLWIQWKFCGYNGILGDTMDGSRIQQKNVDTMEDQWIQQKVSG